MGRIISDEYASKDDPMFTGRHTTSKPKAQIKKPIKVKTEKLHEQDSFFDGAKEIKRIK